MSQQCDMIISGEQIYVNSVDSGGMGHRSLPEVWTGLLFSEVNPLTLSILGTTIDLRNPEVKWFEEADSWEYLLSCK